MDDNLENDKSLQIIRIEKNKSQTIFLYYKPYPAKENSKFDAERTIILFYFEADLVNEKFLKEYLSLAGDIESMNFGKYLNKKGSKKKRRVVQFAVVTFHSKSAIECILDRTNFQLKVNNLIEKKRGGLNLEYDPTKLDGVEDTEVDEEGFVKVSGNIRKNKFSGNGMSFKINRKLDNEEEVEKIKTDGFYNYHLLEKKKKSIINLKLAYDELKNLFEQDKMKINSKKKKL